MKRPPMRYPLDLTGVRVGRLLVLEPTKGPEFYVRTGKWWLCRCDCGTVKAISRNTLVQDLTHSCGCLRAELARERNKRRRKHTCQADP